MKMFLGAETAAPAGDLWFQLRAQIWPELKALQNRNYGPDIETIGIISIILPREYYDEGCYKERRLIRRKTKEADIRLRIDFEAFVRAKPEERFGIYADHLLNAFRVLEGRVSSSFDLPRLLSDVSEILERSRGKGITASAGSNREE